VSKIQIVSKSAQLFQDFYWCVFSSDEDKVTHGDSLPEIDNNALLCSAATPPCNLKEQQ
jgi:hypothetical protein